MSALDTRAYMAFSGDYYLCPLSAVHVPPASLAQLLEPVWREAQALSTVYRPHSEEALERQEPAQALAEGFVYEQTRYAEVDSEPIEWQEQRLVVRSF